MVLFPALPGPPWAFITSLLCTIAAWESDAVEVEKIPWTHSWPSVAVSSPSVGLAASPPLVGHTPGSKEPEEADPGGQQIIDVKGLGHASS